MQRNNFLHQKNDSAFFKAEKKCCDQINNLFENGAEESERKKRMNILNSYKLMILLINWYQQKLRSWVGKNSYYLLLVLCS